MVALVLLAVWQIRSYVGADRGDAGLPACRYSSSRRRAARTKRVVDGARRHRQDGERQDRLPYCASTCRTLDDHKNPGSFRELARVLCEPVPGGGPDVVVFDLMGYL